MEPERQIERALVAKAILRGEDHEEDPLAEISSLARTAGADVVGTVEQRLLRPHPATYLGKGKVEEIAARAEDLDVDVVITDSDLSPAQARNLERITSKTVIDRSQLIMDIFSRRACTPQARMQVELAQLRYALPRLKRLWSHLSRYQGGIGMRGPGETQLETDKRLIGRRIQLLKRKLKRAEGKNETAAAQRESEFIIALVGYTNAGKSTLLNSLTDSHELVEDKLFATLDTRIRRWTLAKNRHVLLTDTVGFIKQLPHHLVASFHATLAEAQNANVLFHVVDSASPLAAAHMDTVRRVLRELDCQGKETWILFNKWDQVPEERLIDARFLEETLLARERDHVLRVSAHTGEHLDELAEAVLERLKREERTIELYLPHSRGDVVAFVQENGRVLEQDYQSDGIVLKAALSSARMAKLKSLFPDGFEARPKENWEA